MIVPIEDEALHLDKNPDFIDPPSSLIHMNDVESFPLL